MEDIKEKEQKPKHRDKIEALDSLSSWYFYGCCYCNWSWNRFGPKTLYRIYMDTLAWYFLGYCSSWFKCLQARLYKRAQKVYEGMENDPEVVHISKTW